MARRLGLWPLALPGLRAALLAGTVCGLACTTTQAQGAGSGEPRGQSQRVVQLDGVDVNAEVAAQTLLEQAAQKENAGDSVTARRLRQRVVAELSDTSSFSAAAVAEARALLDERRAKDAQALAERVLLEDPGSAVADDARYLLALSQLEQGDAQAARPTIKNLIEKMPSEDQDQALLKMGRQLIAGGQGGEGALLLVQALERMPAAAPERAAVEAEIVAAIDVAASFADVRVLAGGEAPKGSVLDEVVQFKLARISVHLRDWDTAARAVDTYLSRFPAGRYADAAQRLKGELASRVAVDTKSIGVILPLTGEFAAYGKRALAAVQIGFGMSPQRERSGTELDPVTGEAVPVKKKGVDPKLVLQAPNGVKLFVRDSGGDPVRAAALVKELVEDARVIAIIGDILIDTALPAALAAEDFGVPLLSLSRKDGVAEAGPWSFRLALTAQKQAKGLVDVAMTRMGMKRFAIMYPRHAYGVELMNAFWDEVDARQGEVTAIESYSHDQTTFTTEAKALVGRGMVGNAEVARCRDDARGIDNDYRRKKALESCSDFARPIVDFEGLFIPDGYRAVSYVVPALVAEDVLLTNDRRTIEAYRKTTNNTSIRPVVLLGGSMWNDPELGKRLGRQVNGAVYVDGYDPGDATPLAQKFGGAFADAMGSRPTLLEAQAHDAGALLKALLAGQGGPAPATRLGLRELLSRTKDFPGVTGLLRFDDQGDSDTSLRYFQLDDGQGEARALSALGRGNEG